VSVTEVPSRTPVNVQNLRDLEAIVKRRFDTQSNQEASLTMKTLELSLSIFLKISTCKSRGKVGAVATFLKPGGYDFYKKLKNLCARVAKNEISLAAAELEVAQITKETERQHTLEALRHFYAWSITNGQIWVDPPKAKYVSPSGLLKVRLNPEVGFMNAAGGVTSLSLWNMARPALTSELAAEGIQCLVNQISPMPNDEVGILNVRKKLVFDKSLVSAGSQARLNHDLKIVEEIWKRLNNPAVGYEETISEITAMGSVPPMS
jgi:hypothetical protein